MPHCVSQFETSPVIGFRDGEGILMISSCLRYTHHSSLIRFNWFLMMWLISHFFAPFIAFPPSSLEIIPSTWRMKQKTSMMERVFLVWLIQNIKLRPSLSFTTAYWWCCVEKLCIWFRLESFRWIRMEAERTATKEFREVVRKWNIFLSLGVIAAFQQSLGLGSDSAFREWEKTFRSMFESKLNFREVNLSFFLIPKYVQENRSFRSNSPLMTGPETDILSPSCIMHSFLMSVYVSSTWYLPSHLIWMRHNVWIMNTGFD